MAGHARATPFSFPPHPEELPALLADLEKYLHTEGGLPPLVRIGLAHVQFETIHPYLDGNGRIGRLLITLLLEHWKLLSAPLLYLSLFFKRHRAEYYRLLGEVRRSGDWEAWMGFFLEGVETTADEAVIAAREVFALVTEDRQRLLVAPGASVMAVRLDGPVADPPCRHHSDCRQITQDDEANRRQGRSPPGKLGRAHRNDRQAARPDLRVRGLP